MSYEVHKGKWCFKGWNKDMKNGFHVAVAFAIGSVLVSIVLNYFTPVQ